jgi:hypothetical protein
MMLSLRKVTSFQTQEKKKKSVVSQDVWEWDWRILVEEEQVPWGLPRLQDWTFQRDEHWCPF